MCQILVVKLRNGKSLQFCVIYDTEAHCVPSRKPIINHGVPLPHRWICVCVLHLSHQTIVTQVGHRSPRNEKYIFGHFNCFLITLLPFQAKQTCLNPNLPGHGFPHTSQMFFIRGTLIPCITLPIMPVMCF